jgi:nucleotide sugar dehydrogenase
MIKTIGIIGKGFVGTAVYEGMKHAFEVIAWDKISGWYYEGATRNIVASGSSCSCDTSDSCGSCDSCDCGSCGGLLVREDEQIKKLVQMTDGPIFICVPTPMKSDGHADISIVEQVALGIDKAAQELGQIRVAIIKSTVPPGTTSAINERVENLQVCFNPEFLREISAIEDFKNQDRIIIGGPRPATNVVKRMYATAYPDVPTTKTSSEIAELVKYVTNCFLATKVSFANEIKQICDSLNVDYDKVIEYATKDKRLGNSHWAVPGPDGMLGYGGSCFPKDINALIAKVTELGIDPKVIKAAWEKNLEVRPEKDWENLKGRAIK